MLNNLDVAFISSPIILNRLKALKLLVAKISSTIRQCCYSILALCLHLCLLLHNLIANLKIKNTLNDFCSLAQGRISPIKCTKVFFFFFFFFLCIKDRNPTPATLLKRLEWSFLCCILWLHGFI